MRSPASYTSQPVNQQIHITYTIRVCIRIKCCSSTYPTIIVIQRLRPLAFLLLLFGLRFRLGFGTWNARRAVARAPGRRWREAVFLLREGGGDGRRSRGSLFVPPEGREGGFEGVGLDVAKGLQKENKYHGSESMLS